MTFADWLSKDSNQACFFILWLFTVVAWVFGRAARNPHCCECARRQQRRPE